MGVSMMLLSGFGIFIRLRHAGQLADLAAAVRERTEFRYHVDRVERLPWPTALPFAVPTFAWTAAVSCIFADSVAGRPR